MPSSDDSQWLSKRYVSRRAALRAGILGAAIPGILYVAKSAASADAADGDIYIPGTPNFLELGHGWPGKEANAGKISYRRWSDALDIVGAGTAAGYRKVKIWDDLYVQGLVNLRAYVVDPEVPPTWTAFLYARSINGQTKPFWKDTTGTAQPLVARSATLIVAASNASPRSKLGADYVCDGTADEQEINTAMAALPSGGGKVLLSEGTFTIAAPILIQDKCVHLQGQGPGWAHADGWGPGTGYPLTGATIITASNTYNNDFITVQTSDGSDNNIVKTAGTTISDLKVYQDFPTTSPNAHGIHPHGSDGVDVCMQIYIRNVSVSGVGGIGIYGDTHEVFINGVEVRGCYSVGVAMTHGDSVITNILAGGNGRSGSDDNVLLKGPTAASNIYAYGGERHGIHIEGPGQAVALSNFLIDAAKRCGLLISGGVVDCSITNGYIQNCGTGDFGEGAQSGVEIDLSQRIMLSSIISKNVLTATNHQLQGIRILQSDDVTLSGISTFCNLQEGIQIVSSNRITISDSRFDQNSSQRTNTYSDILLKASGGPNSTYNRIHTCTFNATGTNKTKCGIEEADASQDNNIYHDNTFDGSQQTKAINVQGSNSRAYRNKGFVTENNGTATIASGSTYVDVTHGLARTPSTKDISVTPTNNLGNASKFWISDIGASTFRINVNTAPGAATATFAWQAEVL